MTTGRINQVATIRYVVVVVLLGLVVWTNVMIDPYIHPAKVWLGAGCWLGYQSVYPL